MSRELSKGQTASRQDMMMELAILKQMEPVLLKGMSSNKYIPSAEKTDISCTLCARDWKGPNNFGFNGVIEWKK